MNTNFENGSTARTIPWRRILGRTGLEVSRLGIASGIGAPPEAFEEAFDRGCNYFYWGAKRTGAMAKAIRNISGRGGRDDLVVTVQTFSRSATLMETFLTKGLKSAGLDAADILLLGWHNKPPSLRLLDHARKLKERGLIRHVAVSGHNRSLFPELVSTSDYDAFHVRYNAAHRGAEDDVFARIDNDNRPGLVTYTATDWRQLIDPKRMPPGQKPLLASDCYRFVLANPAVDVCITGPKSIEQMRENLAVLEMPPLTADEMDRIKLIGDHVHKHGH